MLNFISNKKAVGLIAVRLVVLSSFALNGYASAACTTSNQTNCCGNGVIESGAGETCDMGASGSPATSANTYNKSPTELNSGCKADCTIADSTPDGSWSCSTATDYTTKLNDFKVLFLKLANWQVGNASDTSGNSTGAIATTFTGVGKAPKTDCYYYDSALKPYPRSVTWSLSPTGYNCGQYQKDMLAFITLNHNTQSGTLDCAKARTAMGLAAGATIEFVNPLPLSIVPASNLTATYTYKVKGC